MMTLKPWHCRILLALAVLVVYYPSLHAGYNSVDDMGMIDRISSAGPLPCAKADARFSELEDLPSPA